MTKLILSVFAITFFLLFSLEALAVQSRKVQATPGSPIPSSYSATNNKSLVMSELPTRDKKILLINATNGRIACTISHESSVNAPTTPVDPALGREVYLLASEPIYADGPGRNIYCRGVDSIVTSGELFLHTF